VSTTTVALRIGLERAPLFRSAAFRRRLLREGGSDGAGVTHAPAPDEPAYGLCGVRLAGVLDGAFLDSPYRRCPTCEVSAAEL
jgi:hypothetical protein